MLRAKGWRLGQSADTAASVIYTFHFKKQLNINIMKNYYGKIIPISKYGFQKEFGFKENCDITRK